MLLSILDKLWKTPLTFLADILGLIVVPIALLFCNGKDEHLPHWAWPWCNEWDSINGYSNAYHWEKRWGKEGARKWWPRFLWLAIRNRSANLSQLLGKANPTDADIWRFNVRIPFTTKYLKCQWGYTSFFPGDPGTTSLRVMPKHNFLCSISLRNEDKI